MGKMSFEITENGMKTEGNVSLGDLAEILARCVCELMKAGIEGEQDQRMIQFIMRAVLDGIKEACDETECD